MKKIELIIGKYFIIFKLKRRKLSMIDYNICDVEIIKYQRQEIGIINFNDKYL